MAEQEQAEQRAVARITPQELAKPVGNIGTVKRIMDDLEPEIVKVLVAGMEPRRFLRTVVSAVQRNPELLKCSGISLVRSVMEAAELGLELSPAIGHAYLVPYGNEVQCQPGWKGLVHLANDSGQVADFYAYVVRKGDKFRVTMGLERSIEHEPDLEFAGELTHVYAVVKRKDGGVDFEVMSKAQVDKIRARSKSKNSPAWVNDYDEMARKCPIKRIAKRTPLTPRFQRAVELDNREFEGDDEAPPARSLSLSAALSRRNDPGMLDRATDAAFEASDDPAALEAARAALVALALQVKYVEIEKKSGATCLNVADFDFAAKLGIQPGLLPFTQMTLAQIETAISELEAVEQRLAGGAA